MGVIIGKYSRRKDAPNYDNIVAYQEERNDFLYNVELSLDNKEHAIVMCDGKTKALCMDGCSYVFNKNDEVKWPRRKVDDNTYQITYIDAHKQTGKLTVKSTKGRRIFEIPVEYDYEIKDPEKFISIKSDGSYNRYKTWTSDGLQREINQAISSLVSSKMPGLLESTNLNQTADYLSRSIVDEIKERGILKRLGVSLISPLSFDQKTLAEISQTLAESKTDKESVETGDQVMKELKCLQGYVSDGFNDIKNQNIELTEGTRAHISAVGEGGKLHTSKEIEGLKDFIVERNAAVPKVLDTIKNGQDLIIEDIKKYFDAKNDQVYDEIKKIADKIESKRPLTKEEYVQIAETIAHSDPKDLKNTPQLTLNFILDNIAEDWHASVAADAIYHQLEKWFSSKKYEKGKYKGENMNLCNTSFESLDKLVTTYPEALDEVPYKEYNHETHKKDLSGRLFKELTKSPEGVKYKDKTLKEWVAKERVDKERNKNLKSRVDLSGAIKCYFAVADKANKREKVKEYMSVCYDVGQFWTKTNKIRHFGPSESEDALKRKAYEVGYTLETPQNRKKYLLAFCKLLTTGLLKEENILPIYQEQ